MLTLGPSGGRQQPLTSSIEPKTENSFPPHSLSRVPRAYGHTTNKLISCLHRLLRPTSASCERATRETADQPGFLAVAIVLTPHSVRGTCFEVSQAELVDLHSGSESAAANYSDRVLLLSAKLLEVWLGR